MIQDKDLREQINKTILIFQKRISEKRLNELVEGYYRMFKGRKPKKNVPLLNKLLGKT